LLPSPRAAKTRERRPAGIDQLRVAGIDQDRPDLHVLVGEVGAFEGLAAVGAAIYAVMRAGEHDVRIGRAHVHRVSAEFADHVLPFAGPGGATEHPDLPWVLVAAADRSGHAGVD